MTAATTQPSAVARLAIAELAGYFEQIGDTGYDDVVDEILRAHRILLYGVGREGLMLRAFAMRLMHLGYDAHVVGDMTAPPVASGDLLIVSAGPGHFATVEALQRTASGAGARTLLVTATPEGASVLLADTVALLPGPTMNAELEVADSALLMGSAFELVQLLFYDVCVIRLLERRPQPELAIRRRHTNLE